MAANRQQGTYLAELVAGCTVLPAGFVAWGSHPALGVVLLVAGLGMLIHSLVGFHRIKRLEFEPE